MFGLQSRNFLGIVTLRWWLEHTNPRLKSVRSSSYTVVILGQVQQYTEQTPRGFRSVGFQLDTKLQVNSYLSFADPYLIISCFD